MHAQESTSTRPYLIRAIYEWCTDNGLTPYLAVRVDKTVQVPREYVSDSEIVLNVSYDATSSLQIGNDFIEFKARFGGKPREIMVPVDRVLAIYARESGQGMSFPMADEGLQPSQEADVEIIDTEIAEGEDERVMQRVPTEGQGASPLSAVPRSDAADDDDKPRPPTGGARPSLKLVK